MLIALIAALYVIASFQYGDPIPPRVSVALAAFTNDASGTRLALLRLQNQGGNSLRRQQFCTLTWTNSSGAMSNRFAPLSPTNYVLRAGQSEQILVSAPAEADVWTATFGFAVEPNSMQSLIRKLHDTVFFFLESKRGDYLFFGPEITVTNTP